MEGFFKGSALVSKVPRSLLPKCGACGIYLTCKSSKMPVGGEGRRGILVVGEAPDEVEDERNTQFVGKSGQFLRKALASFGVDLKRDCWTTNSLICRPEGNRTPTDKEIDYCRPNVERAISELKPNTIILVGSPAIRSVLAGTWRDSVGKPERWIGWDIPLRTENAWLCPTWHPSDVQRSLEKKDGSGKVVQKLWEKHLERACEHGDRPWSDEEAREDLESRIEIVQSPREAARIIDEMIAEGGAAAFDYETNCLKPETHGAKILCCSICHKGKRTIAYPWVGEAIAATRRFLRSPMPKVASNLKFEERWSRIMLGTSVRGWLWDVMLSAHHLDQRKDITSVKFQSFVLRGYSTYNDRIKPFMDSVGPSKLNRLESEIELAHLLLYCGVDSLVEYEVAVEQCRLSKSPRLEYLL